MAGNYQTSVLGPIKSHKKGFQRLFSHQGLRRLAQIGVAVYILYLVVLHSLVGENGPTAVASAEAFCPFGGLETLYKYITGNGSFVSHTHLSNLVLLAAVLIAALLLRSAFCGWICPLGFLQDLMALLSRFMQRRLPVLRRAMTTLKKKGAWLAVADRYLRWLKYAVLAWAVGGSAYFGTMVFREFDPWAALLNIAELSFTPGLLVLILLLAASFFVERPWCRYACPLGAVSGLAASFSPLYLKRENHVCTSCKICSRNCPMGLPVHSAETIKHPDCIGCLECVSQCPQDGALQVKLGLPLLGK